MKELPCFHFVQCFAPPSFQRFHWMPQPPLHGCPMCYFQGQQSFCLWATDTSAPKFWQTSLASYRYVTKKTQAFKNFPSSCISCSLTEQAIISFFKRQVLRAAVVWLLAQNQNTSLESFVGLIHYLTTFCLPKIWTPCLFLLNDHCVAGAVWIQNL